MDHTLARDANAASTIPDKRQAPITAATTSTSVKTLTSSSGNGIELTLRNLSLSVIPPPSLLTRVARKLRLTPDPDRVRTVVSEKEQTPATAGVEDEGANEDSAVVAVPGTTDTFARTDRDLRNVGINIFRDVDLSVKPGQGGSGSGKTTLLNTIAGRMNGPEVCTSGSIQCNGVKAKKFWNDGSVGYLQQNDFLMPFLTVRETLNYAAHLRLPRTMSRQKKHELVELVLLELGLKECADTRVGDPGGGESGSGGIRGISGGERRRVSAGVQLLTNPKMLLCDEVTSGLDAFSSYEVMKSLTKLAKSSQKTIVISIHQPRSEIFKLLAESDGQMVLLSRGDVVYSGPVRSVLPWIEATGVGACPSGVNPFDYLLDLSMIDFASEAIEKTTAIRRDLLVQAWAQREKGAVWSPSYTLADPSLLTSSGGEPSSSGQNQPSTVSTFASLAVDIIPKGSGPSFWSQTRVLTVRGWKNQIRDSIVIWGCVGECIVIGLAVGAIYFQLDDSLAGLRSRSSLVYSVGAIQSYLMLMILIYRLSQEIVIYDRERMDRWYGPLPHLVSTVLYSAPPNILYPVVFSVIVYYMTGLRTDSSSHFAWWLLVNVTMQFVTFTFAMLCSSAVRGFSSASLLGNAIFAFFGLSTGFFIVTSSIPVWLRWIKYLAYPNVCYNILASNEFTDNRFNCPFKGPDEAWDPIKCSPWDGNAILVGQLDVKPNHFPGPIIQMLYYFLGFLFVAWLALTLNVVNPTSMGSGPTLADLFINQAKRMLSRKKKSASADHSGDLEGKPSTVVSSKASVDLEKEAQLGETRLDVFSKGLEHKDPVTIRVEGLGLSVSLSRFEWSFAGIMRGLRRERTEKQLLKDVDVVFPAGELTAILGGSGAGKTSLLNVLLHRTSADLKMKGAIYYNDTKNPSLRLINGVSSYVRQDDNFLLSHLTVRETLQYAAQLRMDSSISKTDKYAKVEDIIDLLGLRECADVIVGNTAVKGISGGQRRRVSIGIQLVTEPACLFLDEPTSGLDALTAKAVVLTLKQIAASGRTVVCTIHQPRADIWHVFDNVVLLVTGGCAAYSGRADKVVEYFEDAGHVAPMFTNVPDFILDTASVNLRSAELEEKTRKVVNALVDRFNINKRTMLASQLPTHALGELAKVNPQFASFKKAFPILARRSFVNTFRQKGLYLNRIFQPVFVAIIMTIFFAPLGNTPSDVTSRLGLLQQTSPIVFSGMLNNVAIYPFERDIAYREISDGGYSATSFFMSFLVNEVPLEIFGSLGVTVFMLVITRMKTTVLTFFSFWLIMFGYINTGESIGSAFSTFATHAGFNITVMSAVISVFSFMTGFMSLNIPQWLADINYVSLFKYASLVMTRNEFDGLVVDCSTEQINSGACPYPTGEAVLELLRFQDKDWDLYLGLFVAVVVIYRFAAWLVLVAKDNDHHHYYAVRLDDLTATSPLEIAHHLGVEYVGQVGELTNYHLFSFPKDASASSLEKRSDEEEEQQQQQQQDAHQGDVILKRYEELRQDKAFHRQAMMRKHSHSLSLLNKRAETGTTTSNSLAEFSSSSILGPIHKQELRQRVKRAMVTVDPRREDITGEPQPADGVAAHFQIMDPGFVYQWHLHNTREPGNDINVTGVWEQNITGKGAIVAIIDDGLDANSEDLAINFYAKGSHDFNDNVDIPLPRLYNDDHGTRCAGEIASARNDLCGVGVAWDAKVAGLRILSGPITDTQEAEALNYNFNETQIYSCSWGPPDDGIAMDGPTGLLQEAFVNGVMNGREGKGSIFVFATGNGGRYGDNCNFDGYTNSRYTVSIGAITRTNEHPVYSEACSAQLAVTYSSGVASWIYTCDIGQRNCVATHSGTSAAAPLAAAIYALVLEVRPELNWRDIQYLTVHTAMPIDEDDSGWSETSVGRLFNHKYGYGKLDAYAMVEYAKTWVSRGLQVTYESPVITVNGDIPSGDDDNSGQTGQIGLPSVFEVTEAALKEAKFGTLEHVTVTVNIEHGYRGEVEVELRSPDNIISNLAVARPLDNSTEGFADWTFMSVKHWEESPLGPWTLTVFDRKNPNMTGTFLNWKLGLHGEIENGHVDAPILPQPAPPPAPAPATPTTSAVLPDKTPSPGGPDGKNPDNVESGEDHVDIKISPFIYVMFAGMFIAIGAALFLMYRQRTNPRNLFGAGLNDDEEAGQRGGLLGRRGDYEFDELPTHELGDSDDDDDDEDDDHLDPDSRRIVFDRSRLTGSSSPLTDREERGSGARMKEVGASPLPPSLARETATSSPLSSGEEIEGESSFEVARVDPEDDDDDDEEEEEEDDDFRDHPGGSASKIKSDSWDEFSTLVKTKDSKQQARRS
ncbi:hypothetical protein EDD11_008900 [Mortierella claussenii]|nr:hypothetical protein EDD11_008900 [Mortierella claussenii]